MNNKSDKLLYDDEHTPASPSLSASQRGSFLDNLPGPRASFNSLFKRQKLNEERLMAEDEKFVAYRFKLKVISLFFVSLSVFILVNACIGASSAPFYDKFTSCNRYELTEDCQELMKYTSALYGFEVTGALILVVHGLIGATLLEHIKKVWLIRILNYYTKVALFIYMVDAILRSAMYWKIKNLVKPVEEDDHEIVDFAGYLAVYCKNQTLGFVVTGILLGVYGFCFLANCYLWRLTGQLHSTAVDVEEANIITLERFNINTPSSTPTRKETAKTTREEPAEINEEVTSSYQANELIEDYDDEKAHAKRAKKAGHAMKSINDAYDEEATELFTQKYGPEYAGNEY